MATTTSAHLDPYASIFHRDGTVTLWHVYRQQWVRLDATRISDETLATLSRRDRARIARLIAKIADAGRK